MGAVAEPFTPSLVDRRPRKVKRIQAHKISGHGSLFDAGQENAHNAARGLHVQRIVEVVRIGQDRRRFPRVAEQREPGEAERAAAVLASAALLATSRTGTNRRSEGKKEAGTARAQRSFHTGKHTHNRRRSPIRSVASNPAARLSENE